MAALPLYQMLSGLGDTIYSGFADAEKRRTLADLGKDIQSGNLEGASQKLLASGDIGSALKLVEMKRAQGNQQQLKEVLGQDPMMGGGVSAPQAQGGLPPAALAEEFEKRGYGPNAVAGILGNFKTESGMRPDAMGDGGTSGGLGQWHKARFTNLKNFAAQQGADWRDPRVQVAFTDHELRTTEAPVMTRLQAARTPEEAAKAFVGFERPAGYTPNNPTGAMFMDRRIAGAREFGGGQPVQVADASGSVPQSAGGNDARENLLRFRTKLTSILPGLDQSSATAVQARIGDIDRRLSEMRSDTQYERSLAAEERRTQTQLSAEERRAQRKMEAEDRRSTRQLASEERRAALATEKAPTADQTNAAGFFDRMRNDEQMFTDEKGNPTSVLNAMTGAGGAYNRVVGMLPGGNAAQSEDFQRADRAKEDFISAVLRKESGAAISEGEFAREDRKYFPQPGNSQKVIADKAKARQIAIQSMERTAGPALKAAAPKQQQGGIEQLLQKLPPDRLAKAQKAMELGASEAEIMQALGIK
jgi:hypothetical protein